GGEQRQEDQAEQHEAARLVPPVPAELLEQGRGADGQPHADRQRPRLAQHQLSQRRDHAGSGTQRASVAMRACDTSTSSAATYRSAASSPGHETPSPSAVKNTPNVVSTTPTTYFRCVSGRRLSGACNTAPTATTSASAST